jgi:uncharacterized protein (DUF362 family)
MHRRIFLKNMMAVAGLSATACVPRLVQAGVAPEVAVVTNGDYAALVRQTIDLVGGMSRFVKPGNTVVIKPNMGWDRAPELGANTHPLVVKTLVELALTAGAGRVEVFDYTCNEPRRAYQNSGIKDAVESLASGTVRLEHIDHRKFVEYDIPRGKKITRWDIYRPAMEADCYINVPVAKHHGLSGLSLGLKNSMGVIEARGRLHFSLGQKLADLATVVRADLTVVDATRMLLRNGPQGGRISDVKRADTLVASTDPVAADAYATTLFDRRPDEISSTVAAHEMGLGEMNIDKMRLLGNAS